jgi:NAD(P)H-dependent FMN reductase
MKKVISVSGSASENSSNTALLERIAEDFATSYQFRLYDELRNLPLFTPKKLKSGVPNQVIELKKYMTESDAVIIATPEYLHNIPAVLKNALEWMTESGELADKTVLPITFTPAPPRGEYAMRSLLQSLKASKAKVVAELLLFQPDLRSESGRIELKDEQHILIREALSLL